MREYRPVLAYITSKAVQMEDEEKNPTSALDVDPAGSSL
jgi:hypothetical protein